MPKAMKLQESLLSILLVEDDEVDVMNVQRAFRKHSITNPLHIARNGIEALELLTGPNKLQQLPRIMLLDINMPKMNGLELLQEIRQHDELKGISVFVLTTSNQDRDKVEAYKLNVAGYILKPVDFESFLGAVSTLNAYWKLLEFPE